MIHTKTNIFIYLYLYIGFWLILRKSKILLLTMNTRHPPLTSSNSSFSHTRLPSNVECKGFHDRLPRVGVVGDYSPLILRRPGNVFDPRTRSARVPRPGVAAPQHLEPH